MLIKEVLQYDPNQIDEGLLDFFKRKKERLAIPKTPQDYMKNLQSYTKSMDKIDFNGKDIVITTSDQEVGIEEVAEIKSQLNSFMKVIEDDMQEIAFMLKELKQKNRLDSAGRVPLTALGGSKRMMMIRAFLGLFRAGKRKKAVNQVVAFEKMQDLGRAVMDLARAKMSAINKGGKQ